MLTSKLLICSKCKSDNISGYQIIQTRRQIVIWYKCIDCGRKDTLRLDISEKKYFLKGLSDIFFRCSKCGNAVIIQELRKGSKVSAVRYQCLKKNRAGNKKISSVLYHDLRTLYLNKKDIKVQNITTSLKEEDKIECPNCKNLIKANSNFCSYCQTDLRKIKLPVNRCPSCNSKVKKEAKFCTTCGYDLKGKKEDKEEFEKPDDPFENFVECHFCGANVPDNNVCPACGVNLHCDCGTIYKPGSKFCHGCGKSIPIPSDDDDNDEKLKDIVVCEACGEKVPIGYSFCTKCGFNMEKNTNKKEDKK